MNFRLWLESHNETEWKRAFKHALGLYKGKWGDEVWHWNMIRFLRNIGLDEEAENLELAKPTPEDIEYGNTPISGTFTFGDVLKHKQNKQRKEKFQAARKMYWDVVEDAMDKMEKFGRRQFGWTGTEKFD